MDILFSNDNAVARRFKQSTAARRSASSGHEAFDCPKTVVQVVKASKRTDRRVQRTHRMLSDALIQLILEHGWDAVSVQDICERADVGRSTFYTHFADKEDLLVGGLDALGQFLRTQGFAATSNEPLAFARGMIEHVDEQRRLFKAIAGKRSGQVVQQRFRQLLVTLVREDLEAFAPKSPRLDVAARYVAGAFFELLIWWLETRTQLKPADLEEHFHELTTPVLAVLRTGPPGGSWPPSRRCSPSP